MNVLRLKETMLMNKVEFLQKTVFFLVRPETYWVMCQYSDIGIDNSWYKSCCYGNVYFHFIYTFYLIQRYWKHMQVVENNNFYYSATV